MRFTSRLIFCLVLLISSFGLSGQNFIFAELQGQPTMSTAGWNLNGSAFVGDTPGDADAFNNELILIPPVNSTSGGIFYAQAINPSICDRWTVDFEFRIFDGNAADGLAFCFLQVPPAGFVVGGGVGIPGAANGLKVVFDTYDNGCGANPEIQVYSGVGYDECIGGMVKVNNNAGSLNFIRSTNYNSARITYDSGNISVTVNGTVYIANAYFPINFAGYMGFTSGSGAQNDRHSIRNVTIYTEQAPSNAGPNVTYCSGNSAQIGTATNPNFTYSWSPANGLNQTNISNPTVSLVNNTSNPIIQQYIVTTTLTVNGQVCPSYDTVQVTVNPVPTSTFTVSDTSICAGEAVTLTYTGNMNGSATFNWNFNGATILSGTGLGPYQVSWPTDGPKQIRLIVSKSGCTSDTTFQNLTVYAIPTSTYTKPTEVCAGEEITVNYTGTASSTASYNWNFDGGTIISGANQGPYQVLWANDGLKNLSLVVTENGCVSPQTDDTLRVHPIPTSSFSLDAAICEGTSAQALYQGTANPAVSTFTWLSSGGNLTPTPGNPAQTDWTGPFGNHNIQLVVEQYGCISDTGLANITVHAIPTGNFTLNPEACTGEDLLLTYSGTASAGATYTWQYTNANLISGTGQGPLTIDYTNAGNFNVLLTVTENNCVSPVHTENITVHAIPTSTFDLAAGICEGQTSPLTYTGTAGAGANFNWNFDAVEVVSGTGIGPYVLGDAVLGTFQISLEVTENNCVSPLSSQTFIVLPSPSTAFSATPLIGCTPLPVQLSNLTPTQPGLVYDWNFGNGSSSSEENPLHVYTQAGSFSVTLTATNGFGCATTVSLPNYVNVTAHPIAGFSVNPQKVSMDNPSIQITDNSVYAESISYVISDGATYVIPSPNHSFISEGEYWITQTVTNSLGCTDTIGILVPVIPFTNVFIPNTFTPNADFVNETWNPVISYLKDYELMIFDRWGLMVFQTDDLFRGWNGNYYNNGSQLPQGLYAYRIRYTEFSGRKKEVLGHLMLVR